MVYLNAEHQQVVYVGIGGTRNQESADLFQIRIRVVTIQMLLWGASCEFRPRAMVLEVYEKSCLVIT